MTAKRKAKPKASFSTIHPDAAGLDIGSRFHVVAVAADRDEETVRTFQSFTGDLHLMADWLVQKPTIFLAMQIAKSFRLSKKRRF